jgi:hypothetical protein
MTFRQKLTQFIFNKTVASSVISGVFGAVTTVVVTHALQRDPAPQPQAATGSGTQQVQTPAPSFTPRADQDSSYLCTFNCTISQRIAAPIKVPMLVLQDPVAGVTGDEKKSNTAMADAGSDMTHAGSRTRQYHRR